MVQTLSELKKIRFKIPSEGVVRQYRSWHPEVW